MRYSKKAIFFTGPMPNCKFSQRNLGCSFTVLPPKLHTTNTMWKRRESAFCWWVVEGGGEKREQTSSLVFPGMSLEGRKRVILLTIGSGIVFIT